MRISLVSKLRKIWIIKLAPLRKLFLSKDKKRVFLDCGSNLGQAFDHFSQYYPTDFYDYVLFEPNPHCLKVLRENYGDIPNLEIVDGAVWTEDGTMELFGLVEDHRGEISDGASLLSSHNTKFYEPDAEKALTVPTIDFTEYLKTKLDYDEIIVKMNIEASEYDVLEKMIEKDQIKHVDHFYIGFHAQFMTGDEKKAFEVREKAIKVHLNKRNKLYVWH